MRPTRSIPVPGQRLPFLLLFVLALPVPLLAEERTISVDGSAQVQVAPELVHITFGVETPSGILESARTGNQEAMARLVRAMSELSPKVTLQQAPPSLGEEWRDGKRVAHVAHATLTITADPPRLTEIIAAGLAAGATHVLDSAYAVRDARPYRDQARVLACRAAREKAGLLARELGVTLGEVRSINETSNLYGWSGRWRNRWWHNGYWSNGWFGGYQSQVQNVISVAAANDDGITERQEISAEIRVVFAIR